jgi:hypothetical protein
MGSHSTFFGFKSTYRNGGKHMEKEGNKLKEHITKIMLNQYIENNSKITFWQLEKYLIKAGFSHYEKNGYKKLSIRRKIKPIYKSVVKSLPNMKKDRDITIEILDKLIEEYKEGKVRYSYLQKFFKENKHFLTSKDLKFYKRIIWELPRKKKKIVL